MTILVTGGAGFIGCNIADRLAREGHPVRIYDALARPGVETNLQWLISNHGTLIDPVIADIRDGDRLAAATRGCTAVFHMAAQVAVTTSLTNPRDDFEINIAGTLNLLEALRARDASIPLIFASTNKVYGDLADIDFPLEDGAYQPADPAIRAHGIPESRPLDFHTPYGCSKGAADQYVLDYARSYGLPTAVLRMSCIYGPRQMGTEDQGWVAHFLIRALEGRAITLYGDGHQVRDILDVSDAVDAYMAVWRNIGRVSGRAFNLGGGPANAVSLRALLAHIGTLLGHQADLRFEDWRAGDQRYFVADTRTITQELNLAPAKRWRQGVSELARWLSEARDLPMPDPDGSPANAGVQDRGHPSWTPAFAGGTPRPVTHLRILMTADAVGGVWTYALDLARGLATHGVETILAVLGPPPSAKQRRTATEIPSLTLIETGLPLDWLAESEGELIRAGQAITALATRREVDLVHLNTPAFAASSPSPLRGGGKGREADEGEGLRPLSLPSLRNGGPSPARGAGLPTIAVTHSCVATWWDAVRTGPLPADFAWRTALHKAGLQAADAIIAPSAAHADATHRLYGIRPHVVPNGRAPLAAAPLPMRDEAFTAGRLWDPGKNVATLDRAATRLAVPLHAAGACTGANGETIVLDHAHSLGTLTDAELAQRLAARPVFVSAALYEPFGLAVLEAAQAGCALVLSDIPTFRELWDGAATFVDPLDDAAFAAAVQALIGDPALRSSRGETAQARACSYTAAATAAQTLAIYRSLLPACEAVAA